MYSCRTDRCQASVIRFSCNIRILLFFSTVFREAEGYCLVLGIGVLEGDISVHFFLPLCVCVCVLTVPNLSLATFVHHPVCLITAKGVLQRQLAAGERLFGSEIAIGPFASVNP